MPVLLKQWSRTLKTGGIYLCVNYPFHRKDNIIFWKQMQSIMRITHGKKNTVTNNMIMEIPPEACSTHCSSQTMAEERISAPMPPCFSAIATPSKPCWPAFSQSSLLTWPSFSHLQNGHKARVTHWTPPHAAVYLSGLLLHTEHQHTVWRCTDKDMSQTISSGFITEFLISKSTDDTGITGTPTAKQVVTPASNV